MLPKQGRRERIDDAVDIRFTRIETQSHRVHRLLVEPRITSCDWRNRTRIGSVIGVALSS